jgi:hypothetical protein
MMLLLAAAAVAQDTRAETRLHDALRATIEKGFAFKLQPAASLPGFESAREELAGAPIEGRYAGGVYHAKDGLFEIYKKGDRVAVRTERGWLPLREFTAPLRLDANEAFDGDGRRWSRGNVTRGRKALELLIRLDHLVHRADLRRLAALETAFVELRAAGRPSIDGRPAELYEGDLTERTAFQLLQGPFDELVRRGVLSFHGLSGVGRVYLQDGCVRRIAVKAGGKYGFYNEDDNVSRRGFCTLEIVATLSGIGETAIELPKEVERILNE